MLLVNQNFKLRDPPRTAAITPILPPKSPIQLNLDIQRQSFPKTQLRIRTKNRIARNNIAGQASLLSKGPAWTNRYSPFGLIGSPTSTTGLNPDQQRFINRPDHSVIEGGNKGESGCEGEVNSAMFENYGDFDPRASPSFDTTNRQISRNSRFSVSSVSTSSSGLSSMTGRSESVYSPGWASDESSPRAEIMMHTDGVETGDVPSKIEELDDDVDMSQVPPSQPTEDTTSTTMTVVKRGRGRPRKHPSVEKPDTKGKGGRSKTGCITCRKRKKKCDEGRPECNNCLKNGVVCEGYQNKIVWQPGQKNAQLRRVSQFSTPTFKINMQLPSLIDGVVTPVDKLLLDHYHSRVSRILTVWEDDNHNPFQEILLPMALRDKALMHAILALSGSHLLQSPDQSISKYELAKGEHLGNALTSLRLGLEKRNNAAEKTDAATSVVLLLDNICSGDTTGTYRIHLDAARNILADHQDIAPDHPDVPIVRFLYEFVEYHDIIGMITSLEGPVVPTLSLPAVETTDSAFDSSLMGVLDGLFVHVSEITRIRNEKRALLRRGLDGYNFELYLRAMKVENAIREWQPNQVEGSPRHTGGLLYRHCAWVYLFRTMEVGRNPKIKVAVDQCLELLRAIPENSGVHAILLLPLFLIGCAAFEEDQRPDIRRRFEHLQEWSSLGNIRHAYNVVQEMWRLMDTRPDDESWDWAHVMKNMGYDMLVT